MQCRKPIRAMPIDHVVKGAVRFRHATAVAERRRHDQQAEGRPAGIPTVESVEVVDEAREPVVDLPDDFPYLYEHAFGSSVQHRLDALARTSSDDLCRRCPTSSTGRRNDCPMTLEDHRDRRRLLHIACEELDMKSVVDGDRCRRPKGERETGSVSEFHPAHGRLRAADPISDTLLSDAKRLSRPPELDAENLCRVAVDTHDPMLHWGAWRTLIRGSHHATCSGRMLAPLVENGKTSAMAPCVGRMLRDCSGAESQVPSVSACGVARTARRADLRACLGRPSPAASGATRGRTARMARR